MASGSRGVRNRAYLLVAAAFSAGLLFGGSAAAQSEGERPPPSTEPEIEGLRIKWYVDQAYKTYEMGIENKRAMVLFFNRVECEFCRNLLDRFRCPLLARHAGFLEFGYSTEAGGYADEGGEAMAGALDVEHYPTILMLMPDPLRPHVIARIVGETDAEEVDRVFRNAYKSEAYREGLGAPPDLRSAVETASLLDQQGIARPDAAFCAQAEP